MSTWFCKNLGDAMLAHQELSDIATAFSSAYAEKGCSDEMAAFYRHESEGRLQCEAKVYFSPASSRIAQELGAFPCDKPTRYGLALLAGSPSAFMVFFSTD